MPSQRKRKHKKGSWHSKKIKKFWKTSWALCLILSITLLLIYCELHVYVGKYIINKVTKGTFINSKFKNIQRIISKFTSQATYELDDDDDSSNTKSFQIYDTSVLLTKLDDNLGSEFKIISAHKFVVDTPFCKIPNYNPFHPSIKIFLLKPVQVNCSLLFEDVTTASQGILYFYPEKLPTIYHNQFLNNSKFPSFNKFITHNKNRLPYFKVSFINNITNYNQPNKVNKSTSEDTRNREIKCCYKTITRVSQNSSSITSACDGRWRYSGVCYAITQEETKINHDSIVVYCNSSNDAIYTNVHHFIIKDRVTSMIGNKIKINLSNKSETHLCSSDNCLNKVSVMELNNGHLDQDKLNVIIFGTDSVSRLNFLRKLPKTYNYITKNLEAIEFKGFNKVGDNTFPNMVPILSGLSSKELQNHSCIPNKGPKIFDACPWIWKEFKKHGYISAFMEDSPWMGIFNYVHPGFLNPPTNYYGRPYFLASEKLIGKVFKGNSNVCQGNKLSLQVVQNYSLEFMKTFPDSLTFSLFWSASLTHDFINFATYADLPHLNYIKSLEDMGALNKTVLIFISDHGMRWGKFRKTYLGTLEERLPYLFIIFPKWFKKSHPDAFSNLKSNANALVANYDLHKTLLDLANSRFVNKSYVNLVADTISKGISLFQKIPVTRTCEDAGIPQHFCTCQEMRPINKTDLSVLNAAYFIKNFINTSLKNYLNCLQIKTINILNSFALIWNGQNSTSLEGATKWPPFQTYFLQLNFHPGDAVIEATIKAGQKQGNKTFEILGEISRINSYGQQSHCINHEVLRKFCICSEKL